MRPSETADAAAPGTPGGPGGFRYGAFISYRHVEPDRGWAEWLHRTLETFRTPKALVAKSGCPARIERVFRDEDELPASADLSREIEAALEQSRFLIVVCSPRTPASEWVNREVERFRELGRDDRILALLIEGEPAESFPRALREIRRTVVDADGTERLLTDDVEPLAADVRPSRKARGGHVRRMAKLRLLATVLGCRFDDLRQRHRRRRLSWMLKLSALAAAVLALVAGLAAGVVHQRRAALRQGNIAEFEAGLDAPDWDEDRLAGMEAVVAGLERIAPAEAADARRKLHERFAEAVRRSVNAPRLGPEDVSRIQGLCASLERRAPELVPPLRDALRERLSRWEPVFEIAPPFEGVGEIFDAAQVRIEGGALVAAGEAGDGAPADGAEAGRSRDVLARVGCGGGAEMEARFVDWEGADEVGLALNAHGEMRYGFRLRVGRMDDPRRRRARRTGPRSFAAGRAANSPATLEIARGGVKLRQREIKVSDVPAGPLRVLARRDGGRLTLKVGELPDLAFEDTFPVSEAQPGVFGVRLAPGVGLASLRGSLKATPPEPSPLEKGDALYAERRFADALAEYRRQAAGSVGTEAGQEARYKEALCLESLKRLSEAAKAFEGVAAGKGDRWPPLAACRLWALWLAQGRFDEADALFMNLATRYRFGDLLTLLPDEVRWRILHGYSWDAANVGFLFPNPARTQRLKRAIKVVDFMGLPVGSRLYLNWQVLRACHVAAKHDEAVGVIEEFAGDVESRSRHGWGVQEVEWHIEHSWLLRVNGEASRALEVVDRRLRERTAASDETAPLLLIERARVHASMGKWDESEKDVVAFFDRIRPGRLRYLFFGDACLLKGHLLERRGDREGALAAWREGRHRNWAKAYLVAHPEETRESVPASRGLGRFTDLLLASLTGGTTRRELDALVGDFLARASSSEALSGIGVVSLPAGAHEAAARMQRTQRWREFARSATLRSIPLSDFVRLPAMIGLLEYISLGAFAEEGRPPEVDDLLWGMAGKAYDSYVTGRFQAAQAAQLALAWKGTTNFLGWGGVKHLIEPGLRGPAAYVLGHRLVRLGKKTEAAELFREALADAEPDSPLDRLASGALEKLGASPAP